MEYQNRSESHCVTAITLRVTRASADPSYKQDSGTFVHVGNAWRVNLPLSAEESQTKNCWPASGGCVRMAIAFA